MAEHEKGHVMLTDEEREHALESARACGWAYEPANGGYRYVANGKVSAFVSDENVYIGFAAGGHLLFVSHYDGEDFFMALAKAGRCAERLAGTFRDVEEILSGL